MVVDGTLNWQAHTAWTQINLHLRQRRVQTTNAMINRGQDERTNTEKLASGNMRETFVLFSRVWNEPI